MRVRRPPPKLISVVLPVLNGEDHIDDQLAALALQTYGGQWELVVADNGCTDRTLEIVGRWAPRIPRLTIADVRARRGLNCARNAGAAAARGDFLAFCDADDVVSRGWLEALARAATGADLVGGCLDFSALNEPLIRAWRPDQRPMVALMRDHGWLAYPPGGNLGVWASVAREIGWDERFVFGSSDHDFGWRAQLAGYQLSFAADAIVLQRYRRTIWATALQSYRYGRSDPKLWRAFSDRGMPKPDNRRALRRWRRLFTGLPGLWHSRGRRGRWIRDASFLIGRAVGSVRERVLCL